MSNQFYKCKSQKVPRNVSNLIKLEGNGMLSEIDYKTTGWAHLSKLIPRSQISSISVLLFLGLAWLPNSVMPE